MDSKTLIRKLKNMDIVAECQCGESFRLKDALIFDGTKPFPAEALIARDAMKTGLEERMEELAERFRNATEKAKLAAESVNMGKNVEKIVPEMEAFREKWALQDCRVLSDPIDLLVFNGLSKQKVESIGFVEIKSGNARLNQHQKAIKEAVEDGDVSYRVF